MTDTSITAYRLALDRLQDVSRVLADHFETSNDTGLNAGANARLDEIWDQYRRTLAECQHAFRHVPSLLRVKVPPPPRD